MTTILGVRRGADVVLVGDGQVTMSESVVLKSTARKVRRLHGGRVLCGFAGATADAMTLYELLEAKLDAHAGRLTRACVELAQEWRMDRQLRRLEAMMIVVDASKTLLLTGTGDVLEPEEGVVAIGSGGSMALAAARALLRHTDMGAEEIAKASMEVASEMCVFTNDTLVMEVLRGG